MMSYDKGQEKTPFHISLTEKIHDSCRSNTLTQIKNRLGSSTLFLNNVYEHI